jgi:hypothetical protein
MRRIVTTLALAAAVGSASVVAAPSVLASNRDVYCYLHWAPITGFYKTCYDAHPRECRVGKSC